jgi:chitinase
VIINVNNTSPTVKITSPLSAANFKPGDEVTIEADAAADSTEKDGYIVSVEFFVDNESVGVDNTAPYSVKYTSTLGSHTLTAQVTDNKGSKVMSSPVIISVATGINGVNSLQNSFKVYPNPAKESIILDIAASQHSKNVSYKIVNMFGQIFIYKTIAIHDNYIKKINISSLPNGVYSIELSNDGKTASQKIIKQ